MPALSKVLVASLAASLTIGGTAYAPVFIKFDGVEGESAKGAAAQGWIEVDSFSWGTRAADGRAQGTITVGDRDPVAVGLLLPAVQKVREAASPARSRKVPVAMYREVKDGTVVKTYWLRNAEFSQADGGVRLTYDCKTWRDEASGQRGGDCAPDRAQRR